MPYPFLRLLENIGLIFGLSSNLQLVIILLVATLAQLAERFIRNEQVMGSSPMGGFFVAPEKSGAFLCKWLE
jgi:hypothetical protein